MEIREVLNPGQIKDFHQVQKSIAKDYNSWIIHLKQDIEKVFDKKKNKLFRSGEASRWVVYKNNQPIGRIAAFINKKAAWNTDQPTGGIGFFDCIDDQETANMLFDTAREWLSHRKMEAMDGPINFGERNQFWGLLIENFERENTYGMNYNPPYYRSLFENYGFNIYYEQMCFRRDIAMEMQQDFIEKFERIKSLDGIEFSTAENKSIEQLAEDFLTVYNDAWGGHSGFKSMKKATALKLFKAMKPVMDRQVVYFVYRYNKPIAFFLNVPDLNYYFKRFNGNFNLLRKIHFFLLQKIKTPQIMVGIIFGVVKEYQGKGIEGAMINFAKGVLDERPYKDIVMTWIGDFNPRMVKVAEKLGADVYHRYVTMRFLFDRTKPFKRHPMIGVNGNNGQSE